MGIELTMQFFHNEHSKGNGDSIDYSYTEDDAAKYCFASVADNKYTKQS